MLVGEKRSFAKFANIRHYSSIRGVKPAVDMNDDLLGIGNNYNEANIENYKRQIISMQNRIVGLESQVSSLNTEIQTKTHALLHNANNEEKIAELQREVQNLTYERNSVNLRLKQEIENLKLGFAEKSNEWNNLTEKLKQDHFNKMKIVENEANILNEQLKASIEQDANKKKELETRINGLNQEKSFLLQTNKTNEEEISNLRKKIETIEINNRTALYNKEEQIKTLEANIINLENRIQSMTAGLVGKSSNELQNRLSEITSLNRTLDTMKDELARQRKQNEELNRQREIDQNKFISSENKARELEFQINQKRNEISNAQSELQKNQNELALVRTDLARKDDIIDRLKKENLRNEEKLREMDYQIQNARNEKSSIERQIDNNSYKTTLELRELQDRSEKYKNEIDKLQRERSEFELKYREEKSKSDSLSLIKERLQNEINNLTNLDSSKSMQMQTELRNQILKFELEKTNQDNMIRELNNSLNKVTIERDNALQKIRELQIQIVNKDQEIQNYNLQINNLNLEVEKLKSELLSFKQKSQVLERQNYSKMTDIVNSIKALNLNNGIENGNLSKIIFDMENATANNNLESFLPLIPLANNSLKYLLQQANQSSVFQSQENNNLVMQLKYQIENLTTKLKDAEALKNDFDLKNAENQAKINAILQRETDSKKSIYNFQTEIGIYEEKVKKLTSSNADLQNQLADSRQQLISATENMAMVSKNLDLLKAEKQIISAKLDEERVVNLNQKLRFSEMQTSTNQAIQNSAMQLEEEKRSAEFASIKNIPQIEVSSKGWNYQPTQVDISPPIFKNVEERKDAENFYVENVVDAKYYKPGLRLIMMLFSKDFIDPNSFPDVEGFDANSTSPTLAYWFDQIKYLSKIDWVITYAGNSYSFTIAPAGNAVFKSSEDDIQTLYDVYDKLRVNAINSSRDYFSIDIIYWHLHKQILKHFYTQMQKSKPLDQNLPIFNLTLISQIINLYIRAFQQEDPANVIIDMPYETLQNGQTYVPIFNIEVISGIQHLERTTKNPAEFQFNLLLATFEFIRDAHAITHILSSANVHLRRKNEYYYEPLSYSKIDDKISNYTVFNMVKFHIFHYFSRLQYFGTIDFSQTVDLLKKPIEEDVVGSDDYQQFIKRNSKFSKLGSQYRRNRYKNYKKSRGEDALDVPFEELAISPNISQPNYNPVALVPIEEISNEDNKINLDLDAVMAEDNDVNQMAESYPGDGSEVIEPENIDKIIMHRKHYGNFNNSNQNRIHTKRMVIKHAYFKKQGIQTKFVTIIRALQVRAIETIYVRYHNSMSEDIMSRMNKWIKKTGSYK